MASLACRWLLEELSASAVPNGIRLSAASCSVSEGSPSAFAGFGAVSVRSGLDMGFFR